MAYNVVRMYRRARRAIKRFSALHPNETFYAFAIDGSMLCLNSEEEFQTTLNEYMEKYNYSKNKIVELKYNTGDWEYQGFADLGPWTNFDGIIGLLNILPLGRNGIWTGFDQGLYDLHYASALESENGSAPRTEYAKAMSELVRMLNDGNAFDCLNLTEDFKVSWVEHNY